MPHLNDEWAKRVLGSHIISSNNQFVLICVVKFIEMFRYLLCFIGYRPILDAMKSFAKDADAVDIEVKLKIM